MSPLTLSNCKPGDIIILEWNSRMTVVRDIGSNSASIYDFDGNISEARNVSLATAVSRIVGRLNANGNDDEGQPVFEVKRARRKRRVLEGETLKAAIQKRLAKSKTKTILKRRTKRA